MFLAFTSSVTTEGAFFAVYSVIIGLDLERSCSPVIMALELELSHMGSQDVVSCLPLRFGKLDLGFLWRGLRGIVCV